MTMADMARETAAARAFVGTGGTAPKAKAPIELDAAQYGELKPYKPSIQDRLGAALVDLGLPRGSVDGLVGSSGVGRSGPGGMGLADFSPFGALFAVDETFRAKTDAERTAAAMGLIPGSRPAGRAARKVVDDVAQVATDVIEEIGGTGLRKDASTGVRASPEPSVPAGRRPSLREMIGRPAGSDPRYLGQAPDRSTFTYARYRPTKPSPRLQASIEAFEASPDLRKQMDMDYQRGVENGGLDWYNTEELRDWFVKARGKKKGEEEWRFFLQLVGATSPGSKVPGNLGNASAVRQLLATNPEYVDAVRSIETIDDARAVAKKFRPKGYGHKAAGTQEMVVSRLLRGELGEPAADVVAANKAASNLTQNPKPKGFIQSMLGNMTNMAADLHFTRYMAMMSRHPDWLESSVDVSADFRDRVVAAHPDASQYFKERMLDGKLVSKFQPKNAVKNGAVPLDDIADYAPVWASKPNDNEYAAFEDMIGRLAREKGVTPAQYQAALWIGAGERTGLAEESRGTFMELLRKRAAKTAERTGQTTEQVIMGFIKDNGLLALGPAAAGFAASSDYLDYDQAGIGSEGGEFAGNADLLDAVRRYGAAGLLGDGAAARLVADGGA